MGKHVGPDPAQGFILRRWNVVVDGYGEAVSLAPTRGAAMANAWRSDVFSDWTFGEFLKRARCTLSRHKPHRFGDPITVEGKPAFFVDNNRAYVIFAYPGGKFTLSAHPYDVLPEEYRPDTYRSVPNPTRDTNA